MIIFLFLVNLKKKKSWLRMGIEFGCCLLVLFLVFLVIGRSDYSINIRFMLFFFN